MSVIGVAFIRKRLGELIQKRRDTFDVLNERSDRCIRDALELSAEPLGLLRCFGVLR